MLTKKQLQEYPRGHIFAHGEFVDKSGYDIPTEDHDPLPCVNVANTGKTVRFVAVRGDVPDWAIYCQNPHYVNSNDPEVLEVGYGGVWDWQKIKDVGDKIHNKENIRTLVPCDDEALKSYRH